MIRPTMDKGLQALPILQESDQLSMINILQTESQRDNELVNNHQDLPGYPRYLSLSIAIGIDWSKISGFKFIPYKKLAFLLDFINKFRQILKSVGGSFNGRTTGSGPVYGGSNPPPPASFSQMSGSCRALQNRAAILWSHRLVV